MANRQAEISAYNSAISCFVAMPKSSDMGIPFVMVCCVRTPSYHGREYPPCYSTRDLGK